MSVDQFPLDFDTLKKGDVIPVWQIEEYAQAPVGSKKYDLGKVRLGSLIDRMLEERGLAVTLSYCGDVITVLTSETAAVVTRARVDAHFGAARKNFGRQLRTVDVRELTPESKAAHDRSIEINGRLLGALDHERKTIFLEGCKRSTPTLGAPEAGE